MTGAATSRPLAPVAISVADQPRRAPPSTIVALLHDGRAVAAGLVVALLVIVAVLAPHDPESIDPNASLSGPSPDHWLGADQLGRDVVSRLMFGARLSLQISIESVAFAALVGITVGVLSSYFGGWTELIAMRVVDVLLVFPALVLAITVAAYLGRSVQNIALVIGIVYMPIFARSRTPSQQSRAARSSSRPPEPWVPRTGASSCERSCRIR